MTPPISRTATRPRRARRLGAAAVALLSASLLAATAAAQVGSQVGPPRGGAATGGSVYGQQSGTFGGSSSASGGAFGAAPSTSSRDWVNPDVIALREEVERLSREVERLRGGGVAPSGGGQPVGADAYVRLDAVEVQLRDLIGRIEQIEFRLQGVQNEQAQRIEDLSLRLGLLEQAIDGGVSSDPNAIGIDPNAIGEDPNALGDDPNLVDPNRVDPNGGARTGGAGSGATYGGQTFGGATYGGVESATGGSGLGAPPRPLGTLPGGGASGGQSGGQDASQYGGGALAPSRGGGSAAADPAADGALSSAIGALRSGSFASAETQLSTFLQRYPTHPRAGEAKYWLGETYFVRQQYQRAAPTFLSAYQEHPDGSKAPDSLLRLGMTLAQLNQREEACLTFSQVGQRYPNASANTRRQALVEARRNGCR